MGSATHPSFHLTSRTTLYAVHKLVNILHAALEFDNSGALPNLVFSRARTEAFFRLLSETKDNRICQKKFENRIRRIHLIITWEMSRVLHAEMEDCLPDAFIIGFELATVVLQNRFLHIFEGLLAKMAHKDASNDIFDQIIARRSQYATGMKVFQTCVSTFSNFVYLMPKCTCGNVGV